MHNFTQGGVASHGTIMACYSDEVKKAIEARGETLLCSSSDQQSNEINIDVQWQDEVIVFESELAQDIIIYGNDGSRQKYPSFKALSKARNRTYPNRMVALALLKFTSASLQ